MPRTARARKRRRTNLGEAKGIGQWGHCRRRSFLAPFACNRWEIRFAKDHCCRALFGLLVGAAAAAIGQQPAQFTPGSRPPSSYTVQAQE